jgi:hypothetical protein
VRAVVHPTLGKARTHVVTVDGTYKGDLYVRRRRVMTHPFMAVGTEPVMWVAECAFYHRGASVSGRKYTADTQAEALDAAAAGAVEFVTEINHYREGPPQ